MKIESVLRTPLWLCLFWLPWIGLLFAGCETPVESPPPPTSALNTREGVQMAANIQAIQPGAQATLGSGASMQPLYTENTLIILSPISFEDLAPQMNVAYRNSDRQIVVHQLVRKTRKGWVVQGINNPDVDFELVTEENLIGVVYSVIYTEGNP